MKHPYFRKSKPEVVAKLAPLLKYINETPALLSLLYDIDLLPEQVINEENKFEWWRMFLIAEAWRNQFMTANAKQSST
jgi:hypothetical protein